MYGYDDDYEIDLSFLKGKSDAELMSIVLEYFGDIQEAYPNDPFSSYFPNAVSDDQAIHSLAHRIGEARHGLLDKVPDIDPESKRLTEHEFGYGAVHSDRTPLVELVSDAVRKEASAIISLSLRKDKNSFQEKATPEEIERRTKFILRFCSKEDLQKFVNSSLHRSFYDSSLEDFSEGLHDRDSRNPEVNHKKADFEQQVVPFLQMVNVLVQNGIQLDEIQMADWRRYGSNNRYSIMDVYGIVSDRFKEFLHDDDLVERHEVSDEASENHIQEEKVSNSTSVEEEKNDSSIQEMFEDSHSSSVQEIREQIEANNQRILEIMAENTRLMKSLADLAEKNYSSSSHI